MGNGIAVDGIVVIVGVTSAVDVDAIGSALAIAAADQSDRNARVPRTSVLPVVGRICRPVPNP